MKLRRLSIVVLLLGMAWACDNKDPNAPGPAATTRIIVSPGSLTFTTQQVTTVLSDPTRDDRWFSGTTINAAFPHPTSFIGDYNGIAAGPNGIATLWTDLRAQVTFGGRSGSGSNAEFALVH